MMIMTIHIIFKKVCFGKKNSPKYVQQTKYKHLLINMYCICCIIKQYYLTQIS